MTSKRNIAIVGLFVLMLATDRVLSGGVVEDVAVLALAVTVAGLILADGVRWARNGAPI